MMMLTSSLLQRKSNDFFGCQDLVHELGLVANDHGRHFYLVDSDNFFDLDLE